MVRTMALLLVLALATALGAQKAESGLGGGFPGTTIAYMEGDFARVSKSLSDPAVLKGLGIAQIPDFGKEITERLEIELSSADVQKLLSGIRGVAWGLLDIGVGRPRLKMQVVMRHEDPSLLAKALARARENEASSLRSFVEYEGVAIYELEMPGREVEVDPEVWAPANPLDDFFAFDSLFIAVHENRHIVATTSLNHIKDAIDFLSFPDDTADTLAGNKRFKDALAEFDKPLALVFINTTALINTLERVSGDKGNTPLNEFFGGVIRFVSELLEYKQLKSIAAGLWIDEQAGTLRADARVQFHNEPALYSAIKLKPVPQPLADFIPIETVSATTYGIEKPREVYQRVMNLLRSRAKESGQQEVLRELDRFEEGAASQGVRIEEILDQLANAQGLVVLPPAAERASRRGVAPETVGLLGMRDVKEAETFLYEKLLRTKLGEILRNADLDVTVIGDVEIHHPPGSPEDDPVAFALVGDVFMVGNLMGIMRIVEARRTGATLSAMPNYRAARGMLWEKCGMTQYVNIGAVLNMASTGRRAYSWEEGRPARPVVDATQEDADPMPYLGQFFGQTVMVLGTQARDNELAIRLCMAGWPNSDHFTELAARYRDVARNKQVRNDFIQILDGATTHLVLKGKCARDVGEIKAAGYLPKGQEFLDPYADEGERREYRFAEVPDNVDIRQSVLLAYQAKPGLGGKHLAVLWNGFIVKLSPAELEAALARAKNGQPISGHARLQPLVAAKRRDVAKKKTTMEVEVIDDDGSERVIAAEDGDALDAEAKISDPNAPPPPDEDDGSEDDPTDE